ncbi:MAG: hypothetical protein KJN84_01855, partial [Bacteroidia bacterium]|nr:hypothetical protein [Bacteroidia bacterium]
MNYKSLTVLLLFFFQTKCSFGQFIYYDKSEIIDSSKLHKIYKAGKELQSSLKKLGFTAETFEIFELNDRILMTIDGRFDVYEWRNQNWLNLYKGSLHGYNHNSQKFIYNDKLFSFRGYGFWREHGEIIEFLPEKGEWELVQGTNILPFGFGVVQDSVFIVNSDKCY